MRLVVQHFYNFAFFGRSALDQNLKRGLAALFAISEAAIALDGRQ
jgi:hypothetical protein